jgi:hypothetical protein
MSVIPDLEAKLATVEKITSQGRLAELEKGLPLKEKLERRANAVYRYPLNLSEIDPALGDYGILAFRRFLEDHRTQMVIAPITLEVQKTVKENKTLSQKQIDEVFRFQNHMLAQVLAEESSITEEELNALGDFRFTEAAFALIIRVSGMTSDFLLISSNILQPKKGMPIPSSSLTD